MAFVHSKETRVLVNGYHASRVLKSVEAANERALADSTSFLDDGTRWIPGLRSGTLTINGMFEDNPFQDAVTAAEGTDDGLIVSVAPNGFTAGNPVAFAAVDIESSGITAPIADVVSVSLETQADELVDLGVSVHTLAAATANGTGTGVDVGTSGAGGGAAVLHVTSAGGTNPVLDVTIQHSADDQTYADLVAFTSASTSGAQLVTVTNSVNQYVRAVWSVTGTNPEIEFQASFARR